MRASLRLFWKPLRVGLLGLLLVVLTLGFAYWILKGNIHTVIPHKVYRSAQLDARLLRKVIKQYDIKSIINLRGAAVNSRWYQQEVATAKSLGVRHYDLGLSAYRLPRLDRLKKLVQLLQTVPKPVIVHCQGGADRAGLASAVALLLYNRSLGEAQGAVSLKYFAIFPKSVGRLVLPIYACYLKKGGFVSNQTRFLQWVNQTSLSPSRKNFSCQPAA